MRYLLMAILAGLPLAAGAETFRCGQSIASPDMSVEELLDKCGEPDRKTTEEVDVYGPNVPLMIGARGRPAMVANRIVPVQAYGVKVMSIGFFVKEGDPVIWRGPMIHSAVQQFLKDVEWGPLDYLLFDMPPGTGDAQLSLSQTLPLSGVVMVTTPQDVSLLDVRKGLQMFRKMNVPVLGIVENMAGFACPHCGHDTPIFGEGGGAKLGREFEVPVLGSIPIDPEMRIGGDTGEPIVVARSARRSGSLSAVTHRPATSTRPWSARVTATQ